MVYPTAASPVPTVTTWAARKPMWNWGPQGVQDGPHQQGAEEALGHGP